MDSHKRIIISNNRPWLNTGNWLYVEFHETAHQVRVNIEDSGSSSACEGPGGWCPRVYGSDSFGTKGWQEWLSELVKHTEHDMPISLMIWARDIN